MAKKWQIMYNNGQGWRPYSNKLGKSEAVRKLTEAMEASEQQGDGWQYKLFMVEEQPAISGPPQTCP